LALIIPGRLNRIMNAVVPASLVRGMMAKMFKKTLAKPQPQVKVKFQQRYEKRHGNYAAGWVSVSRSLFRRELVSPYPLLQAIYGARKRPTVI
jgi:hypothetical protein